LSLAKANTTPSWITWLIVPTVLNAKTFKPLVLPSMLKMAA
jgi:hypothetical protein